MLQNGPIKDLFKNSNSGVQFELLQRDFKKQFISLKNKVLIIDTMKVLQNKACRLPGHIIHKTQLIFLDMLGLMTGNKTISEYYKHSINSIDAQFSPLNGNGNENHTNYNNFTISLLMNMYATTIGVTDIIIDIATKTQNTKGIQHLNWIKLWIAQLFSKKYLVY